MKTLIFILLLIPVIGLAQSNTVAFHLFNEENFNLKQEKIQAEARILPNALVSSTPNFTDEHKMLLDSFYLYYFDYKSDTITVIREYYEYDNHGNQTLFAKYVPCESCVETTRKEESSYDEEDHLIKKMSYYWDYTGKQWINGRKDIYTYESNGSSISNILYWWDYDNGIWKDPVKTDKHYDEQGNILLEISSRQDNNTGRWINLSKNEYSYEDGKRTTSIAYTWDECINNWLNVSKEEYSYKEEKLGMFISYKWDREKSQWITNLKEEREFDVNGNETVHSNFLWNNLTNQWLNNFKVEQAYSPEGKMTHYASYRWDTISSQWIGQHKEDYTFDSNGNEILSLYYDWDNTTFQWKGVWKIESIFDDKGMLTSKITNTGSFDNSNEWTTRNKDDFEYDSAGNLILITTYWRSPSQGFHISEKSHYYYSLHNLTNQIDVEENNQIRIYPNPVFDAFTLEINDPSITQCQLINSSGLFLQTLHVEMGVNTFNISHLRQGMYFLKLKAEKGTVVKKIIKN